MISRLVVCFVYLTSVLAASSSASPILDSKSLPESENFIQYYRFPAPDNRHLEHSFAVVIGQNGIVLDADKKLVDTGKQELYRELKDLLDSKEFWRIHSNYDLQSPACRSVELHGSLILVRAKVGELTHSVSWDRGCLGFDQEGELLVLTEEIEQRLKSADIKEN